MSTTAVAADFPDPEVRKYEDGQTKNRGWKYRHTPEDAPEETLIDVIADPIDRMITTRQAAVLLNMSEDTLKKWRVRKRGPRYARYHDGAIRYSLADIRKYIDDHMVEN